MIHPFTLERPSTVEAAARAVQNGALPIAGGTDLVPLLKCEVRVPERLALLDSLPELAAFERREGEYFIGAMVRLRALASHAEIQEYFPALAQSALAVASPQIRAIGTIGGNVMQDRRCMYFNQSWEWRQSIAPCFKTGGCVCHQAPASRHCRAPYYSDVATALCAYGADAELYENGRRIRLPVAELCARHARANATTGPEKVLITGFILPLAKRSYSAFIKESVRASIDFPTFNAAGYLVEENGALAARLVVGAVNSAPVELTAAQALITSRGALLENGAEIVRDALDEIGKNAVLVREAAVSVKVKKASFQGVIQLLEELKAAMR